MLHIHVGLIVGIVGWLSPKFRTMVVLVSVAQNIALFTHALPDISIIFIPDKESKYRTVRLNTGHLATLPNCIKQRCQYVDFGSWNNSLLCS